MRISQREPTRAPIRSAAKAEASSARSLTASVGLVRVGTGERIGLVGCVKKKRSHAAPAADLYTSPLFLGRRRWIEATCDRWFILSALHGLVDPGTVLDPYDAALIDLGRARRRSWADAVLRDLGQVVGRPREVTFEVHAGAAYTDHGLIDGLGRWGSEVILPARGLRQGEQLALYKRGPQ